MQASLCNWRHASHMQHHTSYNTHHAASCIDHTTHAQTAWHFDTTCIHDARRRKQLCRVGDRSKTNCRAASSSSTQSPHPLSSSSPSLLHCTAASVTKQCTLYLAGFRRPDDRIGRPGKRELYSH